MTEFALFETEQHHEELTKWWIAQGWPAVEISHLPPRGCGVFVRGELAAAGFLYLNGTALSNFEWIVADPAVRREQRKKVLELLFEGTKLFAQHAGVKSIFMSTRHQSLMTRLEKHGFQKTDLNMTNLVARVG